MASQFLFLFPGLHTKENFLQGVGIDGQLKGLGLELWCLTTLSTILQLYRGGQFNWWRKPEYPEKSTDLPQITDTLSHNVVSSTPRLSGIRTHNISGDRH